MSYKYFFQINITLKRLVELKDAAQKKSLFNKKGNHFKR